MTNKQSANSKATHDDNLITLEDKSQDVKRASDINNKIITLEDNLGDLQTELNEVNMSVVEGLDRLNDSDLDLTSKVTETYKRLGEIDHTYKSLSGILDNIDSDVKKLALEVSDVAEQSAAELENLEATSSQQYSQLNELNEKLAQRVNDLVRHARETHEQLSTSISHNTEALLKLEKQLVEEIDFLTTSTQERNDKLDAKLGKAEKTIATNKAKILKMQAIDEALDKRAGELEMTTTELSDKSLAQQAALEQLESRSTELAWSLEELKKQSDKHAEQIIDIQVNTSLLGRTLMALAAVEKRHFRIASAGLAILAVAIGLTIYFQNAVNNIDAQHIAGVQTDIESINSKLQGVDDRLESLDGRMGYMSPFSQFGKDSVIHGSQWLAKQSADHFAIQIASSTSKNELYIIAQRYRHYFTEAMSYYTINTEYGQRHVLVYGSFANNAQAAASLWRMPRYINQQRPSITRIGDIQKLI